MGIAFGKSVLQESFKKHGDKHNRTLEFRRDLGMVYLLAKEYSKAEIQLGIVLKARKETERSMSYNIRTVQSLYAEVLRDSGKDLDTATQLFKEMLDYKTKVWGQEHASVQLSAAQHARCLQLKGLTAEAAKVYKKAYPVTLKKWGKNDIDVKTLKTWMETGKKPEECKE